MKYQVWEVISKTELGSTYRYYVINLAARANKVQSTWKSRLEAQAVCDKLNKKVA